MSMAIKSSVPKAGTSLRQGIGIFFAPLLVVVPFAAIGHLFVYVVFHVWPVYFVSYGVVQDVFTACPAGQK